MAMIIERFDAALERSLTLRSIGWRVEAARTGRPFGEIALLNTLVYRVEQVFLIHTNTSLVLQHLIDPTVRAPAADQIAAMLSAIEAFAREAFGPTPPEVHLNRFELGELSVWISHDPSLTLAIVVRGTPSVSIAPQMADALSRVRIRCAVAVRDFSGEVASFEEARPILEPLLRMVRTQPPRRAKMVLAAAAVALVAAVIALVSWSQLRTAAIARREGAYLAALQGEPGIVVNQVRWKGGKARFSGLRDALAAPPEVVLAGHGLAPASFELAPFVSLDPRIVERRARSVLRPPPGVRVSVEGHDLVVVGTAASHWVDEARLLGRTVPGVDRVDDSALRSAESLDGLRAAALGLDASTVTFATGSSRIADQEAALRRAADRARAAIDAAAAARVGACLVVTGHTDASGTAERNGSLSVERASTVGARLAAVDIDRGDVRPVGTPPLSDPLARSVTFHLDVDETRFAPGCGGPP
jgi:OOP family OmpA-OmpF porin